MPKTLLLVPQRLPVLAWGHPHLLFVNTGGQERVTRKPALMILLGLAGLLEKRRGH